MTTTKPNSHRDNYEAVTARIIESLEKGVCPWHQPWASSYYNAKTGHRYRGLNVPILAISGYQDPRWLTFKQALEMDGNVKKGEKGTCIIFWKLLKSKDDQSDTTNDTAGTGEKGKVFPVVKTYTVFNVEQCENLDLPPLQAFTHEPIKEAEELVRNMPKRPAIEHEGQRAFYSPSHDFVRMPVPESFESPAAYYSTLFHELTHSTGHRSRMGRFEACDYTARYGSEPYAKEELVAEIGAAFLRAACGIETSPELDNSASYIQGWLSVLKSDRRFLVNAAAAAQRSSDFILNHAACDQVEDEEKTEKRAA